MKKHRILCCTILLLLLTAVSMLLSVSFGSRHISFGEVLDALLGEDKSTLTAKVVQARIPRTVFGLTAGGALAVSGAIMQSVTRNPIADPSILGVNTGAALAVVTGLVLFHISLASQYIWLALLGAGATSALVYGIASLGHSGATPIKLALSGATVATAFGSLISTIVLPDQSAMNVYRFWQVGSIGAVSDWSSFRLLLPFFLIGIITALVLAPSMNMVALGDEMAASLGVNVPLIRLLSSAAGVVLCGATTALAGPIGFVGLMIPHLLRALIGSDMRALIPLSALAGGSLLLISDVAGRLIGSPGETEVGIVTAIIGAPVFIFIIRKVKVKSL